MLLQFAFYHFFFVIWYFHFVSFSSHVHGNEWLLCADGAMEKLRTHSVSYGVDLCHFQRVDWSLNSWCICWCCELQLRLVTNLLTIAAQHQLPHHLIKQHQQLMSVSVAQYASCQRQLSSSHQVTSVSTDVVRCQTCRKHKLEVDMHW